MAKKESFFWTSYSDLMTSMFFIMLVLFVLVVALLNRRMADIDAERKATAEQLQVIKEIEESTKNIDPLYFEYNTQYKKHVLKIKVKFNRGSSNFNDIDESTRLDLIRAGYSIKEVLIKMKISHPEVKYLLLIEGQASNDNYRQNYELSYKRALALKRFWEDEYIIFGDNCEVVIGGSGDGKLSGTDFMRDDIEENNQRFLIHILPKTSIIENNQ